jgi:checkpoint serine/threonine-protein kinase
MIIKILLYYFCRKFEHAIRTYEGEDPLAPRFEYVKWLEQIYLKHGPESNLMPLIEETVQRFKNDPKYKQDPRFIQILINFVIIFYFI